MKILVTGATGFVGRHVIPFLLKQGHAVTAVARNAAKAQGFTWYQVTRFIAGDIHNSGDDLVDMIGWQDAVLHFAWPGLPHYKDLLHFEENLPAAYRFLKLLVENGAKHLLVTGTCLEYGMQERCLSEEMLANPSNPYALAKDTLRKFLEELKKVHSFKLQWARLFYMYGPGQNPNSLIAQLDQALAAGERVFNMSGGEQLRDYLPVEETARRLVMLLEHPECEGIVNICSGSPISVLRLVEKHVEERKAQIKLNLGYYPYPDYEPMAFWGSTEKFLKYCTTPEMNNTDSEGKQLESSN
jgi:nucleoside-diphosphate-sugar epimerase